jgi:hypothetical protein
LNSVSEVIAAVCHIPAEFHKRGDVSILKLLKESGYPEHASSIDIQHIQKYLIAHPDLVSNWSAYSEDKRTDKGWYFDQEARRVGYYSVGFGCEQQQIFDDVMEACATFIKRELDSIADSAL